MQGKEGAEVKESGKSGGEKVLLIVSMNACLVKTHTQAHTHAHNARLTQRRR